MNQKNKKLHWLAQGFYLLGAVTLLASLALGLVALPVGAASASVVAVSQPQQGGGQGQSAGHCLSGAIVKDENGSDGWSITAPTGQVFTTVAVKAGSEQSGGGCFTTSSDGIVSIGAQACYSVSGIGTGTVKVTQLSQSNICKGISHIEGIYADPTSVPTTVTPSPTTETPAPTTVTPSPTTETPVPTTVTPSPTTETPEPTTETPVPTTPTEATVLPPGDTSTPAPSETVVPTTETPVTTEEPPVSTETAIVPPTGQDPTATPQPSVAPTLPPPPAPSSGQPGLLIPVTGADQTQSTLPIASFLTFLGMALLGLGLLAQSAARRVEVRR